MTASQLRSPEALRVPVVAGVALFVWGVGAWGASLNESGVPLYLDAPPFKGTWRTGFFTLEWPYLWTPALVVAIAIGVLVFTWWVPAVTRIGFKWVLAGSWALALSWTVAIAATSDPGALARPLLNPTHEYLVFSRELESPVGFVSGFLENLSSYPTHVRGHPPGAVLSFWGLDRIFPTDATFAIALLVIAATAAPVSLLAVRALCDEACARRAAVFAGMAPAVVWIGTSADALSMAVIAWAVTAGVLTFRSCGRPALVWAVLSGLAAGVSVTLSYGSVVLLAPLGALVVWLAIRRRFAEIGVIVAASTIAPLTLVVMGFDWIEGYRAVRFQYFEGVASERPQWFFFWSNLAAFTVAIGPAAIAGIVTLRDRRLWVLAGSAIAGVLAADISGMSKGEVERIWLPAVPWVLVATASLRTTRTRRIWAALTMGFTVLLQWKLRPAW